MVRVAVFEPEVQRRWWLYCLLGQLGYEVFPVKDRRELTPLLEGREIDHVLLGCELWSRDHSVEKRQFVRPAFRTLKRAPCIAYAGV